jgi:hypothetical protein
MHPKLRFATSATTWIFASLAAAPALAQDAVDPEIERLILAGQSPQAALDEAGRQEAEGDLLGAASTLERALIDDPQADNVRVAYAALLCKLDDKDAARSELGALRGRPTDKVVWDRMIAACGAETERTVSRTGSLNAQISAGLAYDGNAAESLLPFGAFGITSRDGLAFVGNAQLDARTEAGAGFLYANAFAMTHNAISGPDNTYQYGEVTAGYGSASEARELSAGAVLRHGRVEGEELFTSYGGQARVMLRSGRSGRVAITGEVTHEDYTIDFNDGTRFDVLASFDHTSPDQRRFFVGLGGEIKDSQASFRSYRAARLVGSTELPIGGGGAYASASLTMRYIDLSNEELFPEHKEFRLFSQFAVGIPIAGPNLLIEPAVNFRWRENNAESGFKDYTSLGAALRLVWRI